MPVSDEDKEKTAFSVPRGKYEFNVTPYGLTNAGASYQRLMDCTLSPPPKTDVDFSRLSPTFPDQSRRFRPFPT